MLLTKITLQANHLTSLKHFYKEVMGLPVLFLEEDKLEIRAGNSRLIFEENEKIEDPYYHIAFNIASNKFEEAFEWFKSKVLLLWVYDYKSYVADFTRWNAKSFYFYDPAGNILEIISRFDLNNISEEPFSGTSISNVSELGIVFPALDFADHVARFMEKYSLHFFDKQSPGANFKVAGNDEGLFIMVPEGRNWSPGTGKKSVIFPVSVSFETQNGYFKWAINNEQNFK